MDLNRATSALGNNQSDDARLDEAIDAVVARLQSGELVSAQDCAARFPDIAAELTAMLPGLQAMAALGDASDSVFGGDNARHGSNPVQRTLGDYQILREVGRGGMGVVYEAEQISLARRVALKILPFAAVLDPRHLQRFKNEAMAAAHLDHPNIVEVYGIGCERSIHFYAMRFIEGVTLADVVEAKRRSQAGNVEVRNPHVESNSKDEARTEVFSHSNDSSLSTPQASLAAETSPVLQAALSTVNSITPKERFRRIAEIGIQAAEALDHAHQMGIVHRDVKPSNLMLDERGKLWVTDFGLARNQGDASMTMTGDLVGTLRYMSPEQALAKRITVDHRTDIYSLGVTLYELLTLRAAFPSNDREETLRQIAFEEPTAPRKLDKSIPEELKTIILKAMEKNPDDRYATAREVAEDLRRWVEHKPIMARAPGVVLKAKKWARRHTTLVSLCGVFFAAFSMVLGASSFVVTKSYQQLSSEKAKVDSQAERAQWNLDQALRAIDRMLVKLEATDLASFAGTRELRLELLRDAMALCSALRQHNEQDSHFSLQIAEMYRRIGVAARSLNDYALAQDAMKGRYEIYLSEAARSSNNAEAARLKLSGLAGQLRVAGVSTMREVRSEVATLLYSMRRDTSECGLAARVEGVNALLLGVYSADDEASWNELALELLPQVDSNCDDWMKDDATVTLLHTFYYQCGSLARLNDVDQERVMRRGAEIASTVSKESHAFYLLNIQNRMRWAGRLDEARELNKKAQQSLAAEIANNPESAFAGMVMASSQWDLGNIERDAKNWEASEFALRDAIKRFHDLSQRRLLIHHKSQWAVRASIDLGSVLQKLGKNREAGELYEQEVRFWQDFVAREHCVVGEMGNLLRAQATCIGRKGATAQMLEIQRSALEFMQDDRDRATLLLLKTTCDATELSEIEILSGKHVGSGLGEYIRALRELRCGKPETGVEMLRKLSADADDSRVHELMFLAVGEARLGNRNAAVDTLERAFGMATSPMHQVHVEEVLPELAEALGITLDDPRLTPPWRKLDTESAESRVQPSGVPQ